MSQRASIIVPVYNGEKRVKKCVASIFNQTYHAIELIIIDDGSQDDSYDIIEKYISEHRPEWCEVQLIKQKNRGVSETRNKGIELAAGKYIFFVDQDDMIGEKYCENYIKKAEDTDSDIVVGGYERVSDTGKVLRTVSLKDYSWSPFLVVSPWAHVYRKEYLLNSSIQFLTTKIGEDVYFNILAYANTENIAVLPDNTDYKWVNNSESVSNSKQVVASRERSPLYLLKEIHDNIPNNNCISFDMREYYFIRYVVWYLLFTVRDTKKDIYFDVMDELYNWLKQEYPEYMKNRYILRKPKGEISSISFAVKIIMLLHCLHLDKVILGGLTKRN